MAFAVLYGLTIIPTAIAGVFLLGVLKKLRDEQTEKEQALAPIAARREQQG
jgi:hypothetical protein